MAEEIHNADTVVPWSMVTSVLFNGALGFAMNVAVLFVTTDITAALSSPTGILGYPFMDIFYNATGSRVGSSVMIAIVIVMDTAATIAVLATQSRVVWAFARDRGLPGWRFVSKVCRSWSVTTELSIDACRSNRKVQSPCLQLSLRRA